jgi:ADP-ribosyl-[dinitrogen reductase] hydrolase
MLLRALAGANKQDILFGSDQTLAESPAIRAIARGEYPDKSGSDIQGTGYVVNSLEAALWCFLITKSFDQAVLQAANLGDDADTTAAICGQIAGAFYGESGIPAHWLERLAMRDEITKLADELYAARRGREP